MSSRRSRSRSRSESPPPRLPGGADPITENDYFLKNAEFSVWLREDKRKYFNELSGEKARKYFRKFVKEWNRGKLSKTLYAGVEAAPRALTKHKWTFSSNGDAPSRDSADGYSGASSSRTKGPSMPGPSDLILAREIAAETAAADRLLERKRERRDARDREEEMVGPRAVGRERMLEKKAERRANNQAFRDGGDEGLEVDEATLMGGGSFQQELAKRDAAKRKGEDRRSTAQRERAAELQERASVIREKDKATMDMFMQMAKNRFG
ncbi:hypothetical protein PENSPDRAFT_573572 [Peniophora sp. CONT]|nr:hypothetical protein PENSPDRAFT_573572 [Peniophora sp. CONT]